MLEVAQRLLFLVLFAACFISFWHSRLKVFRRGEKMLDRSNLFLRILCVLVWNLSFWLIVSGEFSRDPWISIVAALLCLLSFIFYWFSVRSLRGIQLTAVFSLDRPRDHQKQGAYALVRHPFYTSYLLSYLAVLLFFQNDFLRMLAFLLIGFYIYAALAEEKKFFNSSLRNEYSNYRKQTGMFFPKVF